jgi:Tol biopolymer transport system component
MTTFERFEREIPELMTELAPARIPDYFDDMLRQTAANRQRPAWATLERWIPMGVLARTQPMRPVPWRAMAILVTLAILLAALVGAALLIGSTPRLPEPFGLARNGSIVFSTADGQIVTADAQTGTTTTLIDSPELDANPWFSNDGTRFAFDRRTPGGPAALFIANADGTGLRQLAEPAPEISWFEWSPTGDRIALARNGDPANQVTIMDPSDGSTTTFQLEIEVASAVWRPNHDQLVITTRGMVPGGSADQGFYLLGSDGTGLTPIVVGPAVINDPTLSPDGTKLAYSTWETAAEGRTQILDIDLGTEAGVDFAPDFDFTDLNPIFSPDGKSFVVERYAVDGYRLTLLSIDGQSPPVSMGAAHPEGTDGANVVFSPDGTKILATYRDDRTTWLFDVGTGEGEQMDWTVPASTSATWQRLAP